MQIAALTERGFVLRERRRPKCGPGEVLVKATACGICTGDLERYHQVVGGEPTEVMLGHEGSGYVAAVGTEVEGLAEGDAVTALDGPYGEYFLTRPERLVRLPQGIDPRWAMGEPVACVVHAGGRFGIALGDRVAVLGSGFMGLLCLQVARLRGAAHVCVIDALPWRLEAARQLGADAVCTPEEVTSGGSFDVVIEAAGTQSAVTAAGDLVRPHGRLILVGFHLSGGGMRQVNMLQWNWQAIDVINGHVRRDDEKVRATRAGVDLLAAGRLVTEPLITSYPLMQIETAFRDLASRKQGLLKVVLAPSA